MKSKWAAGIQGRNLSLNLLWLNDRQVRIGWRKLFLLFHSLFGLQNFISRQSALDTLYFSDTTKSLVTNSILSGSPCYLPWRWGDMTKEETWNRRADVFSIIPFIPFSSVVLSICLTASIYSFLGRCCVIFSIFTRLSLLLQSYIETTV